MWECNASRTILDDSEACLWFRTSAPSVIQYCKFWTSAAVSESLAIFILHSHIPAYYVSLTDVISDRAIIVSFWPPAKELCSGSSHVTLSKLLTELTALLRIVFEMCCMRNVTSLTQNFPSCFIHYTFRFLYLKSVVLTGCTKWSRQATGLRFKVADHCKTISLIFT